MLRPAYQRRGGADALAPSGGGRNPARRFINLAETQQMIVPLTHHLLALIARDARC
jgi:EAL domain-containing protein (putative c-di-GMP-specific phosphodiesterase class I)